MKHGGTPLRNDQILHLRTLASTDACFSANITKTSMLVHCAKCVSRNRYNPKAVRGGQDFIYAAFERVPPEFRHTGKRQKHNWNKDPITVRASSVTTTGLKTEILPAA